MAEPSAEVPLPRRILDATEGVLRRHGPGKTNVVDVARALGMSHGNIYRHFPSKKALLEAVALRWLDAVAVPLGAIAGAGDRPAAGRLAEWFDALRAAKRRKARDDPELFRVYSRSVESTRDVVSDHVATLIGQLERIITDGMAAGEFARDLDARSAARAFLRATSAFHHPALLLQERPPTGADAHAVFGLLLAGLRAGAGGVSPATRVTGVKKRIVRRPKAP